MEQHLIDAHFHLSLTRVMSRMENVQDAVDVLEQCGLERLCIQSIVQWEPRFLTRSPLALLAKQRRPDQIFAFGGIRFPDPDAPDKRFPYRQEAERLIAMGFDGIKLFGKPTMRQRFGEPFDAPVFDDLYGYLEERQIPLLFHVGDPREFWSAETAPAFARENGWIYNEPDFDTYYAEIEGLMKKHPHLRVLYPHFFFLSDDLERLRAFLYRWPSVWIDITPGSEMYHNFSRNPAEARAFFLEFQDRILLGTDNTGAAPGGVNRSVELAAERLKTLCDFLTTEHASGWDEVFHGLSLPREAAGKIMADNFYRYVGRKRPKPVDLHAAAGYAAELAAQAEAAGDPELSAEFVRILDAYRPWK